MTTGRGWRRASRRSRHASQRLKRRAPALSVPDDEAMERVMVLTERMMRRFFSMVREMKGEAEGEKL